MAKEKKQAAPTKYRVVKLHSQGELALDSDGTSGVTVELFALLPDEYEGNAVRKATDKYGEGEYVAIALSSFRRKTATIPPPKIQIR